MRDTFYRGYDAESHRLGKFTDFVDLQTCKQLSDSSANETQSATITIPLQGFSSVEEHLVYQPSTPSSMSFVNPCPNHFAHGMEVFHSRIARIQDLQLQCPTIEAAQWVPPPPPFL